MAKEVLNSENLKQCLWDTLSKLRAKRIDVDQANAIASQANGIMRVVKAEIEIARFVKQAGKTRDATKLVEFTK